ncbi:MAG: hypothetical protein HFG00_03480 [Oscillibacter sp.]|nr:hypothetical protein [Oscillibacter sp.]
MNLQPLYDVKERLEQAAIAGTGLLEEDFRLQRAAENLKPLAAASPVFGKISAGLEKLLAAPAAEHPGLLLDLLALVDAVAYTQGKTGIEGELEPLPTGHGQYQELSCGQLSPLLEALTSTGGGRMEIVQSAWENHPEYFSEYRVLPCLIQDLGDKFTYLANLNVKILTALGPAVVPALKEGFDPAGKAAMARRVEILDAAVGAAENEFYLEMLPKARKDVQLALIWALRHDPSNGLKLLELSQTKKGDAQETAYRALASSRSPEAQKYFEELAEEHADLTLRYLAQTAEKVDWASRLTARLFRAELDRIAENPQLPLTKELERRFKVLLEALRNKSGPEIRDVYRRAAALGEQVERMRTSGDQPMKFDVSFGLRQAAEDSGFRQSVCRTLEGMLMRDPDPEWKALALELYEEYGNLYLAPALLAQLLSQDSAACYEWAEARFFRTAAPESRTVDPEAVRAFNRVFGNVCWIPRRERYEISPLWNYGEDAPFITPLPLLDPRWFGLFTKAGKSMDHLLVSLLQERRQAPEVLAQMGAYLYRRAVTGDNPNYTEWYIRILSGLGWTDWTDFFPERGKRVGEFLYLELKMGLERMPVPLEEKIRQLEQLSELARQKKVQIRYKGWPEEAIQDWITQWKLEERKGEDQHV